MAKLISIAVVGSTTIVKEVINGKTKIFASNTSRNYLPITGGIKILPSDEEAMLNNYVILIADLVNDGIDFTGVATTEELITKLAETKAFKSGSGLDADIVTNMVFNAINDTENLLITKGFSWVKGTMKWFAYTSKYKWDGNVTENYISDTLTIAPAPTTVDFKRFDTLCFNRDLTWSIEKGVEGLTPAHPNIDLQNQIKLTTVLIQYGEVVPTQVVETLIYDENVGMPTEYNVVNPTANIDPNNSENPATNLKSIKFDKPTVFDSVILDNGIEKTIGSIDALLLTVTCGTKDDHIFVVHIHNSIGNWTSAAVEINKKKYGFDPNKLTPQNLIIPFTDFGNPTMLFTGLLISSSTARYSSETSVLWIDNVRFQGGFEEAPTPNSPTTPHPTKLSEFKNDGNGDSAKPFITTPPTGFEALDEGNGIGYRIIGVNPAKYGNIGVGSLDFTLFDPWPAVDPLTTGDYGVSAPYSLIIGSENKLKGGGYSQIIGSVNEITSTLYNNTILGGFNKIHSGYGNSLIGVYNEASTDDNGFVFLAGMNNRASGTDPGGVIGTALDVRGRGQVAVGIANTIWLGGNNASNRPAFTVGIGTSTTPAGPWVAIIRKDGFLVDFSGLVTAPNMLIAAIDTDTTGKVLITKEYLNRTFTVATLPTPASGVAYATVTDATTPTYLGVLTGGGTVVCPVFYNGTAWVSH